MGASNTLSIPLTDELARDLPEDPAEQRKVLELGLREWRIRKSLAAFERGEGSLAYAAEQAGISLREMIPLAYAHGLAPKVAPEDLADPHPQLDQALTW